MSFETRLNSFMKILCNMRSIVLEINSQISSLISEQGRLFFQVWLRERNYLINQEYNNSFRRVDFM